MKVYSIFKFVVCWIVNYPQPITQQLYRVFYAIGLQEEGHENFSFSNNQFPLFEPHPTYTPIITFPLQLEFLAMDNVTSLLILPWNISGYIIVFVETLWAHVVICSIKQKLKHEWNFLKTFLQFNFNQSLNYQLCNESLTKLCRFRFQQKVKQGSFNLPNLHMIQFSANVDKWWITIYLFSGSQICTVPV